MILWPPGLVRGMLHEGNTEISVMHIVHCLFINSQIAIMLNFTCVDSLMITITDTRVLQNKKGILIAHPRLFSLGIGFFDVIVYK